jgi:hypothetical protein
MEHAVNKLLRQLHAAGIVNLVKDARAMSRARDVMRLVQPDVTAAAIAEALVRLYAARACRSMTHVEVTPAPHRRDGALVLRVTLETLAPSLHAHDLEPVPLAVWMNHQTQEQTVTF